MNPYKSQFEIKHLRGPYYAVRSGPWQMFEGEREQCENLLHKLTEWDADTPQKIKALPARKRAQLANRGAILEVLKYWIA